MTPAQRPEVLPHVAVVRPVFLRGAPGIGKSSLVRKFTVPVEDIAGRVTVRGRGGTVLQPGVDLLERASDCPSAGPIPVITDGCCDVLRIRREHAFPVPAGALPPFRTRGPVFRMS
ncbi:hypothetical protein GCM10027200_57660 [Lentzea nigeriaca]